MSMYMKVRKIDNRNKLYGEFDYQIRVPVNMFLEIRAWCWETWGPSIEYFWYNDYRRSYECNSSWCFDTGYSNTRLRTGIIYLATDVEINLFYLKFGNRTNR